MFTQAEYALLLLLFAALILLMSGMPESGQDPWPASRAGAPILVTLLGAALPLRHERGGTMP